MIATKQRSTPKTKRPRHPAHKLIETYIRYHGDAERTANALGLQEDSVRVRISQLRAMGLNLPNYARKNVTNVAELNVYIEQLKAMHRRAKAAK